ADVLLPDGHGRLPCRAWEDKARALFVFVLPWCLAGLSRGHCHQAWPSAYSLVQSDDGARVLVAGLVVDLPLGACVLAFPFRRVDWCGHDPRAQPARRDQSGAFRSVSSALADPARAG